MKCYVLRQFFFLNLKQTLLTFIACQVGEFYSAAGDVMKRKKKIERHYGVFF